MKRILLVVFGMLVAISIIGIGRWTVASGPAETDQRRQLYSDLEKLASEFSSFLTDSESRAFFTAQVDTSPRKNVLVLRDFLLGAARQEGLKEQAERILEMIGRVLEIEARLEAAGMIPRVEAKLPVKGHRDLLVKSDIVYVVASPLLDETEVESLTGFRSGKALSLSPDKAPDIPTVVIVPAEVESLDPDYPIPTSREPSEETSAEQVVDDFVGIAKINISDDHETWWSKDPEIYVNIWQTALVGEGLSSFKIARVDLPGVNNTYFWHNLGDPNSTYRFAGSNVTEVLFDVWEADGGAHGGDDHLGIVWVAVATLPFQGFTSKASGIWPAADVALQIDRD